MSRRLPYGCTDSFRCLIIWNKLPEKRKWQESLIEKYAWCNPDTDFFYRFCVSPAPDPTFHYEEWVPGLGSSWKLWESATTGQQQSFFGPIASLHVTTFSLHGSIRPLESQQLINIDFVASPDHDHSNADQNGLGSHEENCWGLNVSQK